MPSDLFVVTNKEGKEFLGVIGARAPHGVPQEQRKNVIPLENLYLDLGVKDKKMVEDLKIKVGDMVTPKVDFHVMNDGKTLMSKAFDDRIGAAIALRVLKILKELKLNVHMFVLEQLKKKLDYVVLRQALMVLNQI